MPVTFSLPTISSARGGEGHYGLTGHAIKMSKCLKNSGKIIELLKRIVWSWKLFVSKGIWWDFCLEAPSVELLRSLKWEHISVSTYGFDVLVRNFSFQHWAECDSLFCHGISFQPDPEGCHPLTNSGILWNNFTNGRGGSTGFHISYSEIVIVPKFVENLNKDFIKA